MALPFWYSFSLLTIHSKAPALPPPKKKSNITLPLEIHMCKLSYPNNDRELYELVSIFQKNSFSRLEEHIKMLHVDLILDIFYKNYQNPLNSTD